MGGEERGLWCVCRGNYVYVFGGVESQSIYRSVSCFHAFIMCSCHLSILVLIMRNCACVQMFTSKLFSVRKYALLTANWTSVSDINITPNKSVAHDSSESCLKHVLVFLI